MTRPEAIALAQSAGLQSPRIMPHKARDGKVSWNLFHGPEIERKVIVIPANVDKKRLQQAVEQANGQNNG